jgi:predicted dehydrogenase
MNKTIGIGLIGYGGIGRMHALCLRMLPLVYPELPPVRIVAVQTASQRSADRVVQELGADVLATTSLTTLLEHPDLHIVDCCAPTGDHAAVALATIAAGKALFCEKPLAATLAEAEEIVALATKHRVLGGVNFHFRQVPALQEAKRLIDAGLLGDVIGFHLRYFRASNIKRDRPITWRFAGPGSGVLVDLGSHMLDLTHHLLGNVAWVAARMRNLVGERLGPDGAPITIDADDVAWMQLGLDNGAIGSIEVSKLVPGAADDIRIEAYGTNGSLIYDAQDPNNLRVVEGAESLPGDRRIATLSRTRPAASLPGGEMPTGTVAWHAASIRAFLGAYLEGNTPVPSLADGLAVDRVIAAARQSAITSRVVTIADQSR